MRFWIQGDRETLFELHKWLSLHHEKNMDGLKQKWNYVLPTPEKYKSVELSEWLITNTVGEYLEPLGIRSDNYSYDPKCICFQSGADAVAYKLQWF